jgi:ankyrin repeat protein
MSTEVLGGPQSPKALLDAVLAATVAADLHALRQHQAEFLAIPENLAKCADANGNSLAHLAAVHKDAATLALIVEEFKADVNSVNAHGKTPLHEAVKANLVACTKYLMEHGAHDVCFTHTLSTPFHTAASCGSVECLDVLLEHAAEKKEKVNEVDRNKSTALHKCACDGGLRVAAWLVDHGADVNAKDVHDTPPLLVAAKMGRADICELLIAKGAKVTDADQEGNTALHYCATRCLPKIMKLLVDAGASVKDQNAEYCTPLHLCAIHARPENEEWEELLMLLIRHGGEDLLEYKSNTGKIAQAYVPRQTRKLFATEEVRARDNAAAEKVTQQAQHAVVAADAKSVALAERRRELDDAARAQREEQERIAREVEDRLRHEEDARIRMEEDAEQRRVDEEEAKKKKKEQGGKGKGKGK